MSLTSYIAPVVIFNKKLECFIDEFFDTSLVELLETVTVSKFAIQIWATLMLHLIKSSSTTTIFSEAFTLHRHLDTAFLQLLYHAAAFPISTCEQ